MKKELLYTILTIATIISINQIFAADNIDSLKSCISKQRDNKEKIDNIIELAREYSRTDLDSAMFFAEKGLALSIQLDYKEGQLDAIYRKGFINKKKGNNAAAFEYFSEYLDQSKETTDSLRISRAYFQYGSIYRNLGKNNLAIFYYKKSLGIYTALNDTGGMISNYNGLGISFKNSAIYDSASIYYLKTIKLCKTIGETKNLAIVYHNLGSVYTELMDPENARISLFTALDYIDTSKQKRTLGIIYSKLGIVECDLGDLDSALDYYKKSELINRQIDYKLGINDLYNYYGVLFMKKGLFDLANRNFNLALQYFKQQGLQDRIIKAWQNLAELYLDQGKYIMALNMTDSCLRLAKETGHNKKRLDALKRSSQIYYLTGNYKKASDYYTQYEKLKDSIYTLEKEELVAALMFEYERELDQAKILSLENENLRKTKQRNIYLFTGISLIGLSLSIILYLRLSFRKNRIIAEQRILQLEEEKKLLAARFLVEGQEEERKRIATELHDGLGVLLSATKLQFTSIKDVRPENKPLIDKATQFLEQASSDVRKISHNMMPGLLTKLGLCEALEDLFEKLEDTKGMDAVCEIKGARERLPQNQEIMIYRIVQEMVNNTLKHSGAKKIALRVNVLPSKLDILFRDNGKGFEVDKVLEKKSMGLQSIISRVKFLNGTVSINSSPGKGTEFAMQIPVTTDH